MVAMVETAKERGRPERPANVGGAMMDYLKTYNICYVYGIIQSRLFVLGLNNGESKPGGNMGLSMVLYIPMYTI